jgi:hypothetical protein
LGASAVSGLKIERNSYQARERERKALGLNCRSSAVGHISDDDDDDDDDDDADDSHLVTPCSTASAYITCQQQPGNSFLDIFFKGGRKGTVHASAEDSGIKWKAVQCFQSPTGLFRSSIVKPFRVHSIFF